ncbi:hypothetical protein C0585_07375 [Candidatus Woesearchaeota archaeon]|nr:MAG: hypothetical protein C0585_07375 [Candidatus Woesearchaeota archaeon]
MVIPDFSRLIKNKRESMNLTQEQLAKRLNEKESMIQSIEKGRMPSIAFAKKLEKNMDIVLVKEYKNSHAELKVESEAPTIGNMIQFKVRKKN